MDSSSSDIPSSPSSLIPNSNTRHPSLAPVNMDALRLTLLTPEQQATENAVVQLEGEDVIITTTCPITHAALLHV